MLTANLIIKKPAQTNQAPASDGGEGQHGAAVEVGRGAEEHTEEACRDVASDSEEILEISSIVVEAEVAKGPWSEFRGEQHSS